MLTAARRYRARDALEMTRVMGGRTLVDACGLLGPAYKHEAVEPWTDAVPDTAWLERLS